MGVGRRKKERDQRWQYVFVGMCMCMDVSLRVHVYMGRGSVLRVVLANLPSRLTFRVSNVYARRFVRHSICLLFP